MTVAASTSWSPAKAGMLAFLGSEVALFSTLIMTYVWFLPEIRSGKPNPGEVFSWTFVTIGTICLLTSSATVHFAEQALHKGNRSLFLLLWAATILLGVGFLTVTGLEWSELIFGKHPLTISTNHFGSCYFTLVGFHAAHVTVGVIMLTSVLGLALAGQIRETTQGPVLISWYWHFVDGVWIVVFSLVYVIGR